VLEVQFWKEIKKKRFIWTSVSSDIKLHGSHFVTAKSTYNNCGHYMESRMQANTNLG